jgi:alpha-L-arabinofuranosidase
VPVIDASAVIDGSTLHLFCVNRSTDAVAPVELEVPGSNGAALRDGEVLTGTAPDVVNTFEDPGAVAPVGFDEVATTSAGVRFALPPLACAALTLGLT